MVHASNSSIQETTKFKASMNYIVRLSKKKMDKFINRNNRRQDGLVSCFQNIEKHLNTTNTTVFMR